MELDEIMKAFAGETGIEGVTADADGAYHFDIDGIAVMFAAVGDGTRLGMFAEIGEPPTEGREVVYRALLEAMSPGGAEDGLAFSILQGTDRVILHRADPLALTDYAAFKTRLENVVNVAEDWRRNISDFPSLYEKVRDAAANAKSEAREMNQQGFLQV